MLVGGSAAPSHHPDPEFLHEFFKGRRQLFRLLTVAGFTVESIEGTTSGQPNEAREEATARAIDEAISAGDLDRARGDAYLASLRQISEAGTAFSVWIAFEVTALR